MEVAGLVESIPPAMTGGWMTMFMAVFSYVGDVTTVSDKSIFQIQSRDIRTTKRERSLVYYYVVHSHSLTRVQTYRKRGFQ